jgi:transcriptional regulator with XRE-family HTH domain
MPEITATAETTLRSKIIGVKIRHARTKAGLSLQEMGESLGVSEEVLTAIELGQYEASLPQLEVIAFLCNIPVLYFWSEEQIEKTNWNFPTLDALALRQRIIGVLLRQARLEAGHSLEDIAELLNVPTGQVAGYELGKSGVPLSELETLAQYFNVSIEYFLDEGLPAPLRNGQQITLDEIAQISQLPPEVRAFLLNPANLLYVKIAMRLSDMSAETLRGLAEGLLAVTY